VIRRLGSALLFAAVFGTAACVIAAVVDGVTQEVTSAEGGTTLPAAPLPEGLSPDGRDYAETTRGCLGDTRGFVAVRLAQTGAVTWVRPSPAYRWRTLAPNQPVTVEARQGALGLRATRRVVPR
jgi:hypothetical protein